MIVVFVFDCERPYRGGESLGIRDAGVLVKSKINKTREIATLIRQLRSLVYNRRVESIGIWYVNHTSELRFRTEITIAICNCHSISNRLKTMF